MKVNIIFNSHVMDGDSIIFEGDTPEEIKQKFIDWCESRNLDWEGTCPYSELLED